MDTKNQKVQDLINRVKYTDFLRLIEIYIYFDVKKGNGQFINSLHELMRDYRANLSSRKQQIFDLLVKEIIEDPKQKLIDEYKPINDFD